VGYAKTSLRREKRDLREQMRSMGLGYRDIAAEFARRYRLRPRAAWRDAYGWSLQDTADRINDFRGNTGLDPGGIASMTASHLSEYERWPGHGPEPAGRRPNPYLLAVLAAVYDCAVTDLIDLPDRQHLPPGDLLILDKYTQRPARPAHPDNQGTPQTSGALARNPDEERGVSASHGVPGPEAQLHEAGPEPAARVHPLVVGRREVLADLGGGLAAGAILATGPAASGVPAWAASLCHAVVDPVRAARDAAASPPPGQDHGHASSLLADLRRETEVMTTASLMSDYALMAKTLPELIGRAELAQVTGTRDVAAGIEPVLSDLYAVAAWTLIKADRPEAAWIAATRSVHAAAAADDCLRSAAATRCLAEVHMRAGRYADATRVAFLATAHLDAAPRADRDVALCLRGAAMLSAAAAAARRGDSYEAYAALRAARAYATEIRTDVVALGTMFGPVNVAIHNVAVPVELGRPGEAVRSIPAGAVQVPSYLAERKARFLIDIARGYAGVGNARAAEEALVLAEETAPDETRHHRLTRQLIGDLLPRSQPSSAIRALAVRCAVPA
jgi:hypothetical protein